MTEPNAIEQAVTDEEVIAALRNGMLPVTYADIADRLEALTAKASAGWGAKVNDMILAMRETETDFRNWSPDAQDELACAALEALTRNTRVGVTDEGALKAHIQRLVYAGDQFAAFDQQMTGTYDETSQQWIASRRAWDAKRNAALEAAHVAHEPAPTDTQEGLSEAGEMELEVVAWIHPKQPVVKTDAVYRSVAYGHAVLFTPLVRLSDAQSALTACQQENERLRKREAEWASAASYGDGSPMFTPDRLEQSIASMLSRSAELVKALEPFTQFFDKAMEGFTEGYADRQPEEKTVLGWNDANLLMADFNRARAALRPENEGE